MILEIQASLLPPERFVARHATGLPPGQAAQEKPWANRSRDGEVPVFDPV